MADIEKQKNAIETVVNTEIRHYTDEFSQATHKNSWKSDEHYEKHSYVVRLLSKWTSFRQPSTSITT